ncbi:carbohydrate binding domain-containing protein [Actinosynnema sp. NPDC020468]|uniref:carbohydrate binding domain-containing protein n=1 Tax=Actinosynnema sp. NPDC020468 TaxID=3154488 RepID=UPI0033D7A089
MRLSRTLVAVAAALSAAVSGVAAAAPAQAAATPLPDRVFAPYFEAWTGENPATLAQQSGAKYLTFAFLQTATKGSCTPLWSGDANSPVSSSVFGAEINTLKANGGGAIPSFGGYTADNTGTEIADSCTDVNKIAEAFQKVITTYDITRLDLDIEDNSLTNTAGIDRRNKAIKLTEDWAAANGRTIQFSYTLPTTTHGLGDTGVAVLRNAVTNNARIDVVNLMTFDYYDNASHQMANDTKTAAQGLVDQLGQLWPSKTAAQRWAMVGVTEMIGVDDFGPAETFQLADAQPVLDWALSKGINTLSFWALQRDNGSCPGGAAADNCSGIAQQTWEFTHKFAPFTGGTTQPGNDFSVGVSPSSLSVDPGKSATASIATAVTKGSAETVALSSGPAQGGVTASISPSSVQAGASATVTVTAAANATPGTYQFTLTGAAASASHTTTLTVTVNGTQPSNDFSIAVNPTAVSVDAGKSATASVATAVTKGSAQTVALAAGAAQGGVTAAVSPSSVQAGASATVTFTAAANATPGTYQFTVTGTAPSGAHSATVAVTVKGTQPGGSVVNGGFESGELSPWVAPGDSVVTTAHSGAKALQVTPTASTNGQASQSVTLAPNKAYTLKAWVRGNYAYLGVSGGATASTWTSAGDWTQLSVPFTTGASGTVTVYVHGWYGQSPVFADDFTIS